MSFGINYKYNGLLHHSIDRVWIVTKVALPKLEDIHFPDIAFDPDYHIQVYYLTIRYVHATYTYQFSPWITA